MAMGVTIQVNVDTGLIVGPAVFVPLPEAGCSVKITTELRPNGLYVFLHVKEPYIHAFKAQMRVSGTKVDKITRFKSTAYMEIEMEPANFVQNMGRGDRYFQAAVLSQFRSLHDTRPTVPLIVDIKDVVTDMTPSSILLGLAQLFPQPLVTNNIFIQRITTLSSELETARQQLDERQLRIEQLMARPPPILVVDKPAPAAAAAAPPVAASPVAKRVKVAPLKEQLEEQLPLYPWRNCLTCRPCCRKRSTPPC